MSLMTRSRRRLTAGFAVAALAFAHVAIAAQGCLPGRTPQPQMACEEHQSAVPTELLCRVHFQAETQTLDLAKLPQLSPFSSPVLVLVVEHKGVPAAASVPLRTRLAAASAPPPPLTVLYSRFLI